jgi:hypothetical protein
MLSDDHNNVLNEFDFKLDKNLFFKKMDEFIIDPLQYGQELSYTDNVIFELKSVD